ncbi:MAG: UDP-N-acetylmuramoyl-L-alanyl-D-glutamate--2,6-diaminopimelate ligase, partial [Actinomycetes bacterium]
MQVEMESDHDIGSVGGVRSDPATALRPRARPIALSALLSDAVASVPISGVSLDSRAVRPGDLYVGLPGQLHHGARFAAAAVRAGAVAVLTDPVGATLVDDLEAPVVVDPDPRRRMAAIAAEVYGRPADRMTMLGVTGTNGKTTTTYLLAAALAAAGARPGLIGTIGFSIAGAPLPGTRSTVTTPESPDLQALLAVMAERGADTVAMEVSSHALALGRVEAIEFTACAFTNFGSDHLDFHGSVEAYWEAKASLFTRERTRRAVINLDDPRGSELADRARTGGLTVTTLSLEDPRADYHAEVVRPAAGQTEVSVRWPGGRTSFTLDLPGAFNIRNALTSLALTEAAGLDVAAGATGLATAYVPGRMQRVPLPGPAPAVYVDFAHTPQAVSAALRAVQARRIVVVLGCGGDRDPGKRLPMGEAAARGADVVLVTDDNPRTEDPARIRAQVLAGARSAVPRRAVEIVEAGDRRTAIRHALEVARAGDVVAVLGKGHEQGQD